MKISSRPGTDRSFDAVLCDVDNVIRFYDSSRLAELERAAGLDEGRTARVAFAPEVDLPLMRGEIGLGQWVESIVSGFAGRLPEERARELGRALADSPFRADAEIVALLRRVRAAVPLVLVTNATVRLEDDLASMGLSDLADHVVSSARLGVVKPDRKIYEIAASLVGVSFDRCLFVDDTEENVEAAVALGMTGVVYREPADLRAVLGPLPALG
ncbi:HAD-IA family hydrolase [Streptomyces sp. NPDC001904]|uniref:HAD family hydrolase n=1 Tax=Streptomyces sp. NPDC001904 TaxID=3154531 RepID=UPI00332E1C88